MFQISYTICNEPVIHPKQYYTRQAAKAQLDKFKQIFTHFHTPKIEVIL